MAINIFEFNYLLGKKRHLHNLVALANADDHFHEKEEALLYELGKQYGLKESQVKELIDHRNEFEPKIPPHYDEKMDQLFDLVLMILADEEIHYKELEFFQEIAGSYGFHNDLTQEILHLFEPGVPDRESWEDFKLEAKKFYHKE